MQMIKEAEDRLELYRMVFDAENYHLSSSHQIGYLSAEMIQFFFGGQLIKGAAKGVGKGVQFVKKAGKLEKGVEGVKAVEVGVKEMSLAGKVANEIEQFKEISRLFNKTIQRTTTRMGKNGKAIEITFTDGSKIDINVVRVKQWELNLHPSAPSGTLQKVKFSHPIINSNGYKRLPTQQELNILSKI